MQIFISEFEHKILNKTIFSVPNKELPGKTNKEKAFAELVAKKKHPNLRSNNYPPTNQTMNLKSKSLLFLMALKYSPNQ